MHIIETKKSKANQSRFISLLLKSAKARRLSRKVQLKREMQNSICESILRS